MQSLQLRLPAKPRKHCAALHLPGHFNSLCSVTFGTTAEEAAFKEQEILMFAGKYPRISVLISRGRWRQGEDQKGPERLKKSREHQLPKKTGLQAVGRAGDEGGHKGS